jgi:glycosyltransferase involved in cell wall biosynthesis
MLSEKLRVLYVIDNLKMGGAERITVALMPFLTEITPIICTLYDRDSPLYQQLGATKHIALHGKRLADPPAFLRFLQVLKNERIDVIHAQLQHATVFAAAGQLLSGIPYVVTRHVVTDDVSTHKKWRFVVAENFALRSTKKLIYVSDATSKHHQQMLKMAEARYMTIYNGIDLTHFQSQKPRKIVAQELGFPTDKPLVVMVGVMRPGKGHTVVIDAARQLPHVNFLLAGDGESAASIKDYAAGMENVIFLGTRPDVPTILNAVDMLVLPSDMEALPTVLIEAGAASLPAIASAVGGVAEIIVDGLTGIIIPPQNPAALVQAIQRLIADPALAEGMGKAAFERIQTTFTLENQARTLTALYHQVAQKR